MQTVEKSVLDLVPYENNPRDNDAAVESVAASIKEFGFKVPIIVDKNNVIVAGHTRYKAAVVLGMDTVPCIVADDLTEKQVKAFRLADNRVSELAGWDYEALAEEMSQIHMDLEPFGFVEEKPKTHEAKNDEIDLDSFADDTFEFRCSHCGFRFNA